MKRHVISAFFTALVIVLGSGIASAQTSVAGEWDAVFNTPGGPRPFKLVLKVDGEKITGTAKRPSGDVPVTGTVKGDEISFSYTVNYNGNDLTLSFIGKVKGDSINGTVAFGESTVEDWSAKRAAKSEKPKTK